MSLAEFFEGLAAGFTIIQCSTQCRSDLLIEADVRPATERTHNLAHGDQHPSAAGPVSGTAKPKSVSSSRPRSVIRDGDHCGE